MDLTCTSLTHCFVVGGTLLLAIACPSPTTCWAVGVDRQRNPVVLRGRPGEGGTRVIARLR